MVAGLTSINDRAVDAEQIALYRKLKAKNRLPIRAALTWRPDASPPAAELVKADRRRPLYTGAGDDWLKFGAFKLTLDGGMTIGTAFQRHPYGAVRQTALRQDESRRSRPAFHRARQTADGVAGRARQRLATHRARPGRRRGGCVAGLPGSARSREAHPRSRSFVMHASFQSPEAIARMKKMGILADTRCTGSITTAPRSKKSSANEGMRYFFPLRSYLDAGIDLGRGQRPYDRARQEQAR